MHTSFALDAQPGATVHEEILALHPNADNRTLELLECTALGFVGLRGVSRIQELSRTATLELFDNFALIVSTTAGGGSGNMGGGCAGAPGVVTEGGAVDVTDADAEDDLKSQATTEENVPHTKLLSETRKRAAKALAQMSQTKTAQKKVAKQRALTAEESVCLNNLCLDATMENRVRLEVWKDKAKDQAALGRMDGDLVFVFSAMAGNLIENAGDLEEERRKLITGAPRLH